MEEMGQLPEDLDDLGHALTRATAHAVERRELVAERRRRVTGCLLAGLLVFATMTPSHLGPADKPDFLQLTTASASASVRCDIPRGPHFRANEACDTRDPQPQAAR